MIIIYNSLEHDNYDDPIDDAWFWDSPQEETPEEEGPHPIDSTTYQSGRVVATDILWSDGSITEEHRIKPRHTVQPKNIPF